MTQIILETFIQAPPQLCFDYARDIGLHCETMKESGERAVGGMTRGRINLGESVTFEGRHFGTRQRLTARIIEMDAPYRFVDEMTQSRFKTLKHIHEFEETTRNGKNGTLMRDTLRWTSPFGPLGTLADILLLRRHLRKILARRNKRLKALLERQAADLQ
jgi:ligand-binding SRPBCC domain-containing protein